MRAERAVSVYTLLFVMLSACCTRTSLACNGSLTSWRTISHHETCATCLPPTLNFVAKLCRHRRALVGRGDRRRCRSRRMPPRSFVPRANPDAVPCAFTGASTSNVWYYWVEPAGGQQPRAERRWYKGGMATTAFRNKVKQLETRAAAAGFEVQRWRSDGPPLDPAFKPAPRTPATLNPSSPPPAQRPAAAASRFLDMEAAASDGSDGDDGDGSLGSSTAGFFTDSSGGSRSPASTVAGRIEGERGMQRPRRAVARQVGSWSSQSSGSAASPARGGRTLTSPSEGSAAVTSRAIRRARTRARTVSRAMARATVKATVRTAARATEMVIRMLHETTHRRLSEPRGNGRVAVATDLASPAVSAASAVSLARGLTLRYPSGLALQASMRGSNTAFASSTTLMMINGMCYM